MTGKTDLEDENIFDEGEMEDDGTADIIRKAYEESMKDDDDDDDGGFDQPLDPSSEEEPDVVSPEKGRDLLDDADIAKAKGKPSGTEDSKGGTPKSEKKDDESAEQSGEDKSAETDEKADDDKDEAKTDDKAPDLASADIDTLLDGVSDDRKAEISRRIRESEEAMKPFQNPYIQQQMKQFGASPKEVASRLTDLASFAVSNPAEYIAWVAKESATPEKMDELLQKSAKLLGYKITKDTGDDDDDMFSDPETKALKEENARLKAQLSGNAPGFGPDTPERQQMRQAQQQLEGFVNERDANGNLKRPFFEQLKPRISEMAAHHRSSTGKVVTVDDLQRFYDQAAEEARRAFGGAGQQNPQAQQGSAAQGAKPVADQIKEKAAAAQRAQRASKSVDGTGQGANRRPALSDDASLDDVIRHFAYKD
jgi:O6-methylguanine-DNA--protein-cysteine methyltransferase